MTPKQREYLESLPWQSLERTYFGMYCDYLRYDTKKSLLNPTLNKISGVLSTNKTIELQCRAKELA